MNLTKQFFKYVSQNIFGLLGTSCYILADTYFIAQAAGTDGVTLLNLCLPMYNLIFAFGSMIGLGAATRYAILQAQGEARAQRYFSNAILCACLIAIPFMLAGAFCPGTLLQLMGGDADIVALGLNYTRIFLLFTPFFMCNYIFSAFVRNDGDPSLAMVATLSEAAFLPRPSRFCRSLSALFGMNGVWAAFPVSELLTALLTLFLLLRQKKTE